MLDLQSILDQNSIENIQKEVNKIANKKPDFYSEDEDKFWNPVLDKAGLFLGEIRFLPKNPNSKLNGPFVKMERWAFQGPKGWYINDSLKNIGQNDPAQKYNNKLWNDAKDLGKEKPSFNMKKNKFYYINVYIITDKTTPENEGKVKIWRVGETVFKKINSVMNPSIPSEKAINPYDPTDNGANFYVKLSKKRVNEGDGAKEYRDYSECKFGIPSALTDDREKLEKIIFAAHLLDEYIDPKSERYKSYEYLAKRLAKVMDIDINYLLEDQTEQENTKSLKEDLNDEIILNKSSKPNDDEDFFKSIGEHNLDDDIPF